MSTDHTRAPELGGGEQRGSAASPPGFSQVERVCHDEQMTVWTGEIAGSLSMGGYLRESLSYDDNLDLQAVIARDLRSVIGSAFLQAEPPAPCDEPPVGGDASAAPGRSPAGAVAEDEAPDPSPTREQLQAEIDALTAKVDSLSPHGSCACSYDRPGDVCLHHSPALAAAQAEVERLRELLDARTSALTIAEADRSELHAALSDSESKRKEADREAKSVHELGRHLRTLATYSRWQMAEGSGHHPTLGSAVAAAETALRQHGQDSDTATAHLLARLASTPSSQETAHVED